MPKGASRLSNIVGIVIGVVGLLIIGSIWLDHSRKMGTRLVIAGKEAVNYSGSATEAQAKALGAALQKAGYFDGTGEIDVLLNKGEKGVTLSFVVNEEGYTNPIYAEQFRFIAEQVAYAVGGAPLNVQLMNESLSVKKEFAVERSRWGTPVTISDKETVHRVGDATEEQAKALGKALQENGFFNGAKGKDVFLRKEAGATFIGVVTAPAGWTEDALKAEFRIMAEQVAQSVGGKPVTLEILDDMLNVKHSEEVK